MPTSVTPSTTGNDTILGTSHDDTIDALAGEDIVKGYDGNDTIWGNEGRDTLHGGGDNDLLYGGLGGDTLLGDSGHDTLYGGDNLDVLFGGDGKDVLSGGDFKDFLHGGNDEDSLSGDDGDDWLIGDDGNDTLWGGAGLDRLEGSTGRDQLFGGAGHDKLRGGADQDTFVYLALSDSTASGLDIISDFEHGIDKIDVSALGYTGITTHTAASGELRIAYSAASDRTYVRDDHSDFEIALKGDYRGILTQDDFTLASPAGKVGYYESEAGTGGHNPGYESAIHRAGLDAVSLDNLTAGDLAGLDAVFIMVANVNHYGSEFLAAGSALADYVSHGGVLIIHDQYVKDAATILPGITGEHMVQNLGDEDDYENVDFVNDTGAIANGPGGTLTDTSLDFGGSSNTGYATDASLSSDVVRVQTTGDTSHVTSFAYAYGAGAVFYSTTPISYFLSGHVPGDSTENFQVYVENLLTWAVQGHHDLLSL